MDRGKSIVALLLAISLLPATSIYAWQMTQDKPEAQLVEFKVVVNGQRQELVYVSVNLDDGLSREECELIAEKVFTGIMGDTMHRLDELSVDGSSVNIGYTWGVNEGDMGHFFDISGDVASHTLTVTHCR